MADSIVYHCRENTWRPYCQPKLDSRYVCKSWKYLKSLPTIFTATISYLDDFESQLHGVIMISKLKNQFKEWNSFVKIFGFEKHIQTQLIFKRLIGSFQKKHFWSHFEFIFTSLSSPHCPFKWFIFEFKIQTNNFISEGRHSISKRFLMNETM